MKKQKKSRQFGIIALVTFVMAFVLAVVGMSTTMQQIDQFAISKTPEAILASAGLSEEKDVYLAVAYFDRRSDDCVNLYDAGSQAAISARQFEWSRCRYYNKGIEQGLVEYELSDQYLPVATGKGKLTTNKGLQNLDGWFEAEENKSASYTGSLKLEYQEDGAEFAFYHSNFYPLDGAEFSNGDVVNSDGHNHLFTMSLAAPFTVLASGEESFAVSADDDTFVYIGNQLALDMGGIHDATLGRFVINDKGEVYTAIESEDLAFSGITVEQGAGSIVRIFHADRDSSSSVFDVKFSGMNLSITDEKLASRQGDGVQIAYDPTDPTYIAPLGETSIVKPDGTKGFIVIATVEGVMVVVFAVLMAAAIRSVVRRQLAEREAEKQTSQK